MISTRRRLEYASGFLGLGMLAEATTELAAIRRPDQHTPAVLKLRTELQLQARQWTTLELTARELTQIDPADEQGWIHWAYALRELNRIAEAQAVLREAEPKHGATCAVLHYNLACYACLLGDEVEARRRLKAAFKRDETWKQSALEDPDLEAMWPEIRRMK
jgi:predicted Zn-dependent protease